MQVRQLSTSFSTPSRWILALPVVVAMLFCLSAERAQAEVLSWQTDHSASIGTGGAGGTLFLGTGLDGYVDNVVLWLGNSGAANLSATISCYTNPTYTTACPSPEPMGGVRAINAASTPLQTPIGTGNSVIADFSATTTAARTFLPNRYYRVDFSNGAVGTIGIFGVASPDQCIGLCGYVGSPYFILNGNGVSVVSSTETRFISVSPYDEQTVATSTGYSFTGILYVNDEDFEEGMYLRIKYAPNSYSQTSTADPESLFTVLEIPIETAGANFLSTTSPLLEIGRHTMVQEIRVPSTFATILSWFGLQNTYDAGLVIGTTTQFISARMTGYDNLIASTTGALSTYLASSTISMASCNSWVSFSLGDCLALMLIPQSAPIGQALTDFKNGFLTYVPFGYATRLVSIFATSTIVVLPDISYTFPDDEAGIAGMAGTTLTMHLWDSVEEGTPLMDEFVSRGEDPKTAWEIVEVPFTAVIWSLLVLRMVSEILKLGGHEANHAAGRRNYKYANKQNARP